MRRLNVVITRAKCGVAIIGNTATLSGGAGAEHELMRVRRIGIG
jgi:superfamily I DNA and/or RNA helicase